MGGGNRPSVSAVVLAGGSGIRFWPLSRELTPKQLLTVFGTEALIAKAVRRTLPVIGDGPVLVVTNERLVNELRDCLVATPFGSRVTYVVESSARNTGPAVALAAAELGAIDPETVMVVLPADHLMDDGDHWTEVVETAVSLALRGLLVAVGVTPTRADGGNGYIQVGEPLTEPIEGDVLAAAARRFVHQPGDAVADALLASGDYLWNAGIFVVKASVLLCALAEIDEDGRAIVETCTWVASLPPERRLDAEVRERWAGLPPVSIDEALMAKADNVVVVRGELGWSDVGSLVSLEALGEPDEAGNVRVGRGVDVDSKGNLVYSADRLVATLGVSNLLVVDTTDATLVADKSRAQDVRLVVNALKTLGAVEVIEPRTALRPWGTWTSLLKRERFHLKVLTVNPGARLSLQHHRHRSEHWIVVEGTALVTRGRESVEVHANESAFIPVGWEHRLENCGKVELKVIEVQVGEYLGEDDIIRSSDDWDRGTEQ